MLIYRDVQKKDVPAIARIENISFSQPWSKKGITDFIKQNNSVCIVAEEFGKVVGYVGFYHVMDEGNITNLAVLPGYKRIGVGENLMRFLIEKVNELGVKGITLEVRESNEAAISLYTKLGFDSVGIRKRFYEKPVEDAIIMWKFKL